MPTTLTSTATKFECLSEDMGKKKHDFSSDTFKLALITSAQTLTAAGQTVYADITGEVANGNGYTTGGATLSNVTYTRTEAVSKFDCDDQVFTATGAITARQYVVYNDTHASKPLVYFGLIKNDNTDVVLANTETLTFIFNASGLFTVGA